MKESPDTLRILSPSKPALWGAFQRRVGSEAMRQRSFLPGFLGLSALVHGAFYVLLLSLPAPVCDVPESVTLVTFAAPAPTLPASADLSEVAARSLPASQKSSAVPAPVPTLTPKPKPKPEPRPSFKTKPEAETTPPVNRANPRLRTEAEVPPGVMDPAPAVPGVPLPAEAAAVAEGSGSVPTGLRSVAVPAGALPSGAAGRSGAIARYVETLRQRVQRELRYPLKARKWKLEGKGEYCFEICSDGSLGAEGIRVIRSAGRRVLDEAARQTILRAAPFPRPPVETLTVTAPIVFELR